MSEDTIGDRWMRPYLQDLKSYCFSLTGCKWDGEDLFQDCLLKIMSYHQKTSTDRASKQLLFQAAKHLWIDKCRTVLRRQRARWPDDDPLHHADPDYADIRGTVEWLAERFPSRNIELWLLSEYFGYSMQEIAFDHNLSVPAVKSALHRTRLQLRTLGHNPRGAKLPNRSRLDVECWTKAIMSGLPPCP